MAKSLEQVVAEGLIADCSSLEELYVLWQTSHHMEEDKAKETCYQEIDQRSFHIDGIVCPQKFSGVIYLLKEPSLKQYIEKGLTFPVITDIRQGLRKYRRGFQNEYGYLVGMQRILLGEEEKGLTNQQVADTLGIVYLNKRGGKEVQDNVWLKYSYAYIEFIKRQIQLIQPRVIVCGGEEIFDLVIEEVFSRKRTLRSRVEEMIWKGAENEYQFTADSNYRYTSRPDKVSVIVVNMWNPCERKNGSEKIHPQEFLQEFERRIYRKESSKTEEIDVRNP